MLYLDPERPEGPEELALLRDGVVILERDGDGARDTFRSRGLDIALGDRD